MAYKILTDCDLPQDAVTFAKNATYTFDDFCCLISEHRYRSRVSVMYLTTIDMHVKVR